MLPIFGILLAIFTAVFIWVTNKVGTGEMRLLDSYRVRLRLAYKLLFLSRVFLFIYSEFIVIFETINEMLCVAIRILVLWSSLKGIFGKIKSVLLFQVSAGAHSIDLSKINIYRVPIFGSI